MRMNFGSGSSKPLDLRATSTDLNRISQSSSDLERHLSEAKIVKYLAIEDFETHGLLGSYDPSAGDPQQLHCILAPVRRVSGKRSSRAAGTGWARAPSQAPQNSACSSAPRFGRTTSIGTCSSKARLRCVRTNSRATRPCMTLTEFGTTAFPASPVPFIDSAAAGFMHNFELHRGKSPGLSLVIPFPDDDIIPDALIKAAIESCFHQITTN